MIFSIQFWLAVFIFIDLFSAWWYANGRDIRKVVIMCTAAICGMIGLILMLVVEQERLQLIYFGICLM